MLNRVCARFLRRCGQGHDPGRASPTPWPETRRGRRFKRVAIEVLLLACWLIAASALLVHSAPDWFPLPPAPLPPQLAHLVGITFHLDDFQYNGHPVAVRAGTPPTLVLDADGRVGGKAVVNTYSARWQVATDGRITWVPLLPNEPRSSASTGLVSTLMANSSEELTFLFALDHTRWLYPRDTGLVLESENREWTLVFTP